MGASSSGAAEETGRWSAHGCSTSRILCSCEHNWEATESPSSSIACDCDELSPVRFADRYELEVEGTKFVVHLDSESASISCLGRDPHSLMLTFTELSDREDGSAVAIASVILIVGENVG